MTPGYDVELLHVALDRARAALAAVQRHKTPYWITWRLARLRREIEEFTVAVWHPENTRADNLPAPSGGVPEAQKSRRQEGKPTPANP
jgi:hypothetical protein